LKISLKVPIIKRGVWNIGVKGVELLNSFKNNVKVTLKGLFRAFVLASFAVFSFVSVVFAVDGAVSNQNSAYTETTYQTYAKELSTLKDELALRAQKIGAIIACQKEKKIYKAGACVPFSEKNPDAKPQASEPITSGSCSGDNQTQYFDGTNWTCKDIRKKV